MRVQVCDTQQEWRLHASFATTDQAKACIQELWRKGIPTRMIDCRCCPTAS